MSAPRPGALPNIFSLEPGVAWQERRGRFFVRSDMGGEARQLRIGLPNPGRGATRHDGRMSAALDLVARMISAIEAGDVDGVQACYSPEITVWANFDGKARDLDGSLKLLSTLVRSTSERRYEIGRREEIVGGVLQQHVLHGTVTKTGKSFALPACLVITVDGDRISRVDEYLDPAAMAPAYVAG